MATESKFNNYEGSMSEYLDFNINIAQSDNNGYDPISFDKINILNYNVHPRSSISILRDNNKPYFYNIDTLINIIELGDSKDPFTRKKFDEITIERIYLYKKCLDTFPDLNKDDINYNQIYNDWINDKNNPLKLLKAQSLIQPSNIMDYFRSYNGKYNFNNRDECVKELLNKPNNSWILRNSSIKDTDIQKAYCLSFKKNDVIKHYLIIHKIGYGFYFGVKILRGKILKNNENFNYIKLYPSIIHLIQEQLSILSLVI